MAGFITDVARSKGNFALVSVIIVAAGKSERFKGPISKPYLELGDKPVIVHILSVFSRERLADEIILVVNARDAERIRKVLSNFSIKVDKVVFGGKRRQDSVACGLREISPKSNIVLLHDGVRPFVSQKLINRVIEETRVSGAVAPAIPCEDTIKEVEKQKVVKTLQRNSLWAVQTPQGFKRQILFSAYKKAEADNYQGTDDAELVEHIGYPVKIIPGDKENIKITTPADLVFAEALLKRGLP